ncbi:MAG: DNA-binding protein WhiA [Firmicutes bacterium]|nr:DNA-binding protein WhiA [Bacillota bacterium]
MPSFSRQVKNELVRYPYKKRCCALAELQAFLQMSGRLTINKKAVSITLQTQSASVARRIFSLFKFCFAVSPEILFCRRNKLRGNSTFLLRVPDKDDSILVLRELGFLKTAPESDRLVLKPYWQSCAAERGLMEKCCRRAYLRGSFLAGGSINNPTTPYHLEIVAPYHSYAQLITDMLSSFNLEGRYFKRKEDFVVYLKGAEKIGEFLRIVSAHNALLAFENVRIVKGVRNRINRLVNCETANLTKTVFASQEQISNIGLIEKTMGLKALPPTLRQVAQLRLRFPEATLQELGEMAVPPLSKSAINHRLRRINTLAQKIRENSTSNDN